MSCYHCKIGELIERPKSYTCTKCGLIIWKLMSGKQIDKLLATELFTKGHTEILDGFVSKKNKPFKASLSISSDGEVKYKFPEKEPVKREPVKSVQQTNKISVPDVDVRLEANKLGVVNIYIRGTVEQSLRVDYGIKPTHITECLALITAIKIINFRSPLVTTINISCSSQNFSKYLIKERNPRDKLMREIMSYLYKILEKFTHWTAVYEKNKYLYQQEPLLSRFPFGAFPWMKSMASARKVENGILVQLPDDPAVKAQFLASFWKVEAVGGKYNGETVEYMVSVNAENALKTWMATVVTQKEELINKSYS